MSWAVLITSFLLIEASTAYFYLQMLTSGVLKRVQYIKKESKRKNSEVLPDEKVMVEPRTFEQIVDGHQAVQDLFTNDDFWVNQGGEKHISSYQLGQLFQHAKDGSLVDTKDLKQYMKLKKMIDGWKDSEGFTEDMEPMQMEGRGLKRYFSEQAVQSFLVYADQKISSHKKSALHITSEEKYMVPTAIEDATTGKKKVK